jgi:hypothetical protein
MMRLEGAKIMISNNTNEQKDASSPVRWFGNLPRRILPDEGVDPRLAGFPANLLYSQIIDPKTDPETSKFLLMICAFDPTRLLSDEQFRTKVRAVWYYPDPTSYVEDAHKRQMQYDSRKAGEYSITVAWDKDQNRWETHKYKGNELVCLAFGEDFNSAMWQTTAFGPRLDETLDTQ